MKKKIIIPIILISIVIILISILVVNSFSTKIDKKNYLTDYIKVEEKDENIYLPENYIFTSYNELEKNFNQNNLTEEDFNNNNYALLQIRYNPCSEKNISLLGYVLKGNVLTAHIEYDQVCGGCAPEELNYLVKIPKEQTSIEIKYDNKVNKKEQCDPNVAYKPMIYLYPKEDTHIKVLLKNKNLLTTTYPKYNDGWEVIAKKDGTLVDKNNKEYYGLYWEGINHKTEMKDEGFVVKGEETIEFLEEKLSILGLNQKEANEFIIYWLPKLEKNPYNYIYFEKQDEIDNYMPLTIEPKPDKIIRILMDYKPLKEKITIKEEVLEKQEREGFTVIEWGGSIIK